MIRRVSFLILYGAILCSCAADLKVTDLNVTWSENVKMVRAEIANVGHKDAGKFLVRFDGLENPESPSYRPRVTVEVPGLPKGEWLPLEADFSPLARPENNYLANVFRISVTIDAEGVVREVNEENNTREAVIP